ncbi:MAG: fluoride efflux transporter CrcB [Acidimicrobiales bacterium]
MTVVLVTVAGAVGALLRYEVELTVRRRRGAHLPLGILLINVSGAFVLGVLAGMAEHHGVPTSVVTVAGTGLIGAYTTFSTFSFDTVSLVEHDRLRAAVANVAVSLVLGLGAAAAGLLVGHAL